MSERAKRLQMPLLRRAALAPDPIGQFASWWEVAEREVPLPDAMTLATVRDDGSPDARMVLLKGHDERGFRFFTNFESSKARQLDASRRAALVVYWRELDRQVRVRGEVSRLEDSESDDYFATRAPDSRLGAWASPQSRPLADRAELERLVEAARERLGGEEEIPRPEFWGGYLLRPDEVEFWQGQQGAPARPLPLRARGGELEGRPAGAVGRQPVEPRLSIAALAAPRLMPVCSRCSWIASIVRFCCDERHHLVGDRLAVEVGLVALRDLIEVGDLALEERDALEQFGNRG